MDKQPEKKSINIKKALNFGWETTIENFLFLIGVMLIVYLWQFSSGYFLESLESKILILLLHIIFYAVSTLLSLGLIKIALKYIKKEKPNLETLFSCKDQVLNKIIADLIYFIVVAVGLILLIIPGIYLALKYGFYSQFIADKKMGPIAALKASAEITKQVKMQLFLFIIILSLINFLGAIFFVIGLLFTIPLTILAHTYIYKKLSAKISSRAK